MVYLTCISRTDDVDNPIVNPKKAFIIGVIDKEIRLSFAKRIRETLPTEYHKLILEGKYKDQPDFKYVTDRKY
jgi:nuclear cap-binding protein subunit 1